MAVSMGPQFLIVFNLSQQTFPPSEIKVLEILLQFLQNLFQSMKYIYVETFQVLAEK